MDPVTVACVYKPGGDFTDEYVTRLCDGVARHCSVSYRFVCLTDQKIGGVTCIPLAQEWPGWWNKLQLFREFKGPTVYFDLDTVIVGDLNEILVNHHGFSALSDFNKGTFASGVMAWSGDYSFLYDDFSLSMIPKYSKSMAAWGDQGYIAERLFGFDSLQELHPGRFVSYKKHVRKEGRVPEGTSVVCFHGKPRPHQVGWKLP